MIYTLILLSIVVFYPFSQKTIILENGTLKKKNTKLFSLVISTILISVLGLRNITVGIDTLGYYESFVRISYLSINDLFDDVYYEYGYRILQFSVAILFKEYQILLIFVAIIYIGAVSMHIYNHSKNSTFSYILFILYGFYTFAFSATRQALAIAIILIAYEFIVRNKTTKVFISIVIAASFHITSLIFIFSFLISKIKLNKYTIIMITTFTLIIIYFKEQIFTFLNGLSRIEYSLMDTGGNLLFLFMIMSVALGIFIKKRFIDPNKNNRTLFYMMCLGIIIMPITTFHPVIMRLFYYFFIFLITYIPNMLYSIKNPIIRLFAYFFYTSVGIYFFYTNVIPNANLEDYTFFWE